MTAKERTIKVNYMARVEGEGALFIKLKDGLAEEVRLDIFEPPRFFESLLRGRAYTEAPDITSRICGICPVAYLMSACHAMEDALGIHVEGPLRSLRRLLYAGEWMESHALHVFLLHAPDFLGYPDALTMAKAHGPWVQAGLRMKKAGNALLKVLGGREVHPINIRVGGFYRAPTRLELEPLLPELQWAQNACSEALKWMSTFSFPDFERDYEFVSLRHPDEYPFCEGRVVSSKGIDIDVHDYEQIFAESQVPHSTALHSAIKTRGAYLTGPLARFNLNFDKLYPEVQTLAQSVGLSAPCNNPFKLLLVRMVELAQVFREAIDIIKNYKAPEAPFVTAPTFTTRKVGHGATEAPRGLLYHRYEIDESGNILDAKIVPPTSQNQWSIEQDLAALAPSLAALSLKDATHRAEQAVRNHDPCISCATHFLTLTLENDLVTP